MSQSSGSVGYIYNVMFIKPTIARVPLGFSGYIWFDTKIVFKKSKNLSMHVKKFNFPNMTHDGASRLTT